MRDGPGSSYAPCRSERGVKSAYVQRGHGERLAKKMPGIDFTWRGSGEICPGLMRKDSAPKLLQ